MTATTTPTPHGETRLHMTPIDLGVAVVVIVALLLGVLLRGQTVGHTTTFEDKQSHLRITYPASWQPALSLEEDALLNVEDRFTSSTFKTSLVVETNLLDPANAPTLQTLVDRRIDAHNALSSYTLLSDAPGVVDGQDARMLTYSYVVKPLDTPLLDALPVVVVAHEAITIANNEVFYITLVSPSDSPDQGNQQFESLIKTVKIT